MGIRSSIKALWTSGKGITLGLPDSVEGSDPIDLFDSWYADAQKSGLYLPESMTVATCSTEGRPSARTVFLKSVDASGFVFFTNYGSRKASELDTNPFASLLFHWPILQRQVRIEGPVKRVSREESEAYFHSRVRGSQIGAWASDQSQRLSSRAELQGRFDEYEAKFKDAAVPLPEHWGGFRVFPERMEFWQGRPFRLHDRLIFERTGDEWKTHRLSP
ncbi:MAG: pyridoxamine 5'-phosphate oxidase [Bacteroidetes bacterium]|nr:pyridoxamine 5'-phosphate oxidase [Bacteroidota bacterium]